MRCPDIVRFIVGLLGLAAVLGLAAAVWWLLLYTVVLVGLVVTCPVAPALDVCGWWRAG